jgi:hypothetical protein
MSSKEKKKVDKKAKISTIELSIEEKKEFHLDILSYYKKTMAVVEKGSELISSSPIKDNYFTDSKKVKAGAKIIYKCIEKSAKVYIELNGGKISKKAKESEITSQLAKIDMHAYNLYNDLHTFFYVLVYSRGYNNSKRIKDSIKIAKKFIKLLKPLEKSYKQHKSDAI